jgi:hypothetical protein
LISYLENSSDDDSKIPDDIYSFYGSIEGAYLAIERTMLRVDVSGWFQYGCPFVDYGKYSDFVFGRLGIPTPNDFPGDWCLLD